MLTQFGGAEFTASASKFSLHGNGGNTRTLAAPVMSPTFALTKPACPTASLATVKLPLLTVPFNWSSDHSAAGSSRMKFPCASNSRARKFTLSPGFKINSVGTTCTQVGGFELTGVPAAIAAVACCDELLCFLPMQYSVVMLAK